MPASLSNAQKRYLRGLAHELKPVVLVGAKGITPALLTELNAAIEQHELIKVKVAAEDRETRDGWIDAIVEGAGASLVGRIGHVAVLYRPRKDKPLVILPEPEPGRMQLTLENPDFRYSLRGVSANGVQVNETRLGRSFILSPMTLVEDWRPTGVEDLVADDMAPLLALQPSVIILGTGTRQRFPSPAVMAACLTRGIGIEVMDNAAAARTFNVLATEARKVVAGFLLSPQIDHAAPAL